MAQHIPTEYTSLILQIVYSLSSPHQPVQNKPCTGTQYKFQKI